MPWFKCSACRIRRSGLDVAASAAQDRCPLCGRELTPERDLASLVGFRFLTSGGPLTQDEVPLLLPDRAERTADTISDALATARWLDEGGTCEPVR